VSGDQVSIASPDDVRVYVWDVARGETRYELSSAYRGGWINDIAISPDSRFAAIGAADVEIIVWDLTTGEQSTVLQGHEDDVHALIYSPDGHYLYSGGRNGTLFQWDVQSGEIVRRFAGHENTIHQLDLNSDGSRLLSVSEDQSAVIWDTDSGQALMTLRGHTDGVTDADLSPDDNLIVTASHDGRIIVWDAQTGEKLYIFVVASEAPYLRAVFSPDGSQVVSGANDMLTFWDITDLPDDYTSWVTENRYIPEFTCDQRDLYQIEPLCDP